MPITRDQVTAALRTVNDPELHKDVVTLGMVRDVLIAGDAVEVRLEPTGPERPTRDRIERDAVAALKKAGATDVAIKFVGGPAADPTPRPAPGGPSPSTQAPTAADPLPHVGSVIAVGAGKGGVGKSTVAVNLAVALQRSGKRVGLMDGDVYGPSLPTLLGIKGAVPKMSPAAKNKILPHRVHGIHAVTLGSLVEQDKPLVWRGPMAQGAFRQLLVDNTEWPELDHLIIDLPPGTGDVPLTMCQLLPLSGAVVVATPQQVALDDAVRAVKMFQQLGVPVLGMVENMSVFVAPDGTEHDVFGRGGTARAAEALDLPLLGSIALHPELRINSDAGRPHANFEGPPALRSSLEELAGNVAAAVAERSLRAMPTLRIS